jgi:hypothetical protein
MQENTSAPIPRSNTLPNALAETERVKRPEPGGLQRVNTHLGNYSTGKSSKDDFEGVNVSQLRRVPTSSARLGGTPTVASPNLTDDQYNVHHPQSVQTNVHHLQAI